MDFLLVFIALLMSSIGLLGCVIPVLPGTAFSYLGLLAAFMTSYSTIPASAMWIWLIVSVGVILADFVFPAVMTRFFGGTRYGAIGATVGIIVGLLAGPAGVVLGPFFGAVVGELLHDKNDPWSAMKSGFGSFMAFVVGTGLKLLTSIWMLSVLLADLWPVVKGACAAWF